MGTVIVDQFNPIHGYWNKLYEVDSADFDPDAPILIDKYGGPYRTRHIGEPDLPKEEMEGKIEVVIEEEEEVKEVFEEEEVPKFNNSRW